MAPILRLDAVSKHFDANGQPRRTVLSGVSLVVAPGERVAIVGRSGTGKSTLVHIAAGIELPSEGRVEVAGVSLGDADDAARTRLRRDRIGFVFQFFYLVPHLTVEENVALPGAIAGDAAGATRTRARELLERVGLADRAADRVRILSGGEMQRVAICRALLRRPALLLADEPTGNLDDANSAAVMSLVSDLTTREGAALLYVTHSAELARAGHRVLRLHDGALESL